LPNLFSCLFLEQGIDAAEGVAAVVAEVVTKYVWVQVNRPVEIASLQRSGYQVTHAPWSSFMVKPLTPDATIDEARRLYGIGTDRFLISCEDESSWLCRGLRRTGQFGG
jgi:hypothetical protein